jgi:pyruvate kinase
MLFAALRSKCCGKMIARGDLAVECGFERLAEVQDDAAMSERAECVMLNKGPHVCEAVSVLHDILQRMEAHMTKKRSMLRELKVAGNFLSHETP